MGDLVDLNTWKKDKKVKEVEVFVAGCFFWDQTRNTCLHKFFSGKGESSCTLDDCPRKPKKE